jgi:glyoxylase-like metal-dependent hydrolase (beta-lactamase superfamily II)
VRADGKIARMRRSLVAIAVALGPVSCGGASSDAQAVVRSGLVALGAAELKSIQYVGTAQEFALGQSERADGPWPRLNDYKLTYAADFTRSYSHTTLERQNGKSGHIVIRETGPWIYQLDMWTTPWGFLWGALAHEPTVEVRTIDGRKYDVVSWVSERTSPGGVPYRLNGYINEQHVIERVETWLEHPFFGDLPVDVRFDGYKEFAGLKVPTKILKYQAGWPRMETTIADAIPNPPKIAELLQLPEQDRPVGPRPRPPAPEPVKSEKLADGVHRILGDYVSLAVEFADHVVVVEGPGDDARTTAVIAEVNRVIPAKPIRFVVNTHHHDDHAGGLPAYAAQGVTILTHEANKTYLDRALNGPRTLGADLLARSKKKAQFETVGEVRILKDAARALELHHIPGLTHADGMLIAYLPQERIVVQADMGFIGPNAPGAGEHRAGTLVATLERLKLNYDTVVFVHRPQPDRRVTKADLLKLAASEK